MATNYVKIEIPLFVTSDGIYHAILCRGSKNLSQSATDTLTLNTFRHFEHSDVVLEKYRDVNNRLLATDITELIFIDGPQYSGVSNGSPVNVDLTNEKLTTFKHFINDRSLLYTLWIRRKKANGTYEYLFCGDFKRKDVKFIDQSVYGPSTTGEFTTGLCRIQVASLKRRLEDLTIEDLLKTFTSADLPERGDGDTSQITQPHYAGIRYMIGAASAHGAITPDTQKTLNFGISQVGRMHLFDYSIRVNNWATPLPAGAAPFPLSFHSVSFYKLLSKIFSHASVGVTFGSSSYDDPCYLLGYQLWSETTNRYVDALGIDGSGTMPTLDEIFANLNILFGIHPRPDRTYFANTINTTTNTITTPDDHQLRNGDIVYYFANGSMPGGLTMWQPYYVINATTDPVTSPTDQLQLSLTEGGSAVDITSAGSGVNVLVADLFIDTPNTLQQSASALELLKRICVQFGYFMELGVTQSGGDEGKPTIYFRERFQTPPSSFPLTKLAGSNASGEEPPRKPMVIKIKHIGDEDEIFTPRLPEQADEVLEINPAWRIHSFGDKEGLIWWSHIKLNDKLPHDEQIQCTYSRYGTDLTNGYLAHEYSHVVGTHLFRFLPKNTVNSDPLTQFYPHGYDNSGQHDPSVANTSFEGHHVWNIAVRSSSDYPSGRMESLAEYLLRYHANDLLRGQYPIRRRFRGVVDSSNSALTIKPLCSYSTRRETAVGVARNYYTDKTFQHLKAQFTETVLEEQADDYATLESFPVFRKTGSGITSGASRTSTPGSGDSGGGTITDKWVPLRPEFDDHSIIQSKTGDYYNLRFRPYNGSATKDIVRFEAYDGATLFSKFNASGEFYTYRQAAININPYGTSAGNTGELRFYELVANGAHYVGFKSPDALAGNTVYTWPNAFPAGTYVLQATTAGVMSWVNPTTLFDSSGLVTKSPATSDRNLIIATADGVEALAIKRYSGTSAGVYTFSIYDASGLFKFGVDGNMNVRLDASSLIFGTNSPISLGGSHGTSGVSVITSAGSGATPTWTSIDTLISNAVITNPAASTRNVVQPTGNFIAQVWKNSGSQTANLVEWHTSGGSVMSSVSKDGYFRINDNNTATAALQITQPASVHGIRLIAHSATGSNDGHPVFIQNNGSTINLFTMNDVGAVGMGTTGNPSSSLNPMFDMLQTTAGLPFFRRTSPTTGDDPFVKRTTQNRVASTSATPVTIHTFDCSVNDRNYTIMALVQGFRTSGGTAGDGGYYLVACHAKNVGGTLTIIGQATIFALETPAGYNVDFLQSGENILLRWTGIGGVNSCAQLIDSWFSDIGG